MIISTLEDSARAEAFHPAFKKLFSYVKATDFSQKEPGRIELDGDNLFINYMDVEGEPPEKRPLEVHRKYIDVHILLSGKERIGWLAPSELKNKTQDFSKDCDMALYSDTPSLFIDLLPGQFAIIYPEDPHAPIIGEGKIRKLIAKIKI